MKFYEPDVKYVSAKEPLEPGQYIGIMITDKEGKWATRAVAEQAAKDAVWAARLAQQAIYELYNGKPAHMRDYGYVASQAIIERYEGGKG